MRLRACLLLIAASGAGGALLMAADLYRRVKALENVSSATLGGAAAESAALYGTAHVLWTLALAILFMGLLLMVWNSETDPDFKPLPEAPEEVLPEADGPAARVMSLEEAAEGGDAGATENEKVPENSREFTN